MTEKVKSKETVELLRQVEYRIFLENISDLRNLQICRAYY